MSEPTTAWAIFQYDKALRESRLVGVYWHATDANRDAMAMSNADTHPTVEPFDIHTSAQYATHHEPAVEADSGDFDMPIHVSGEVTQ